MHSVVYAGLQQMVVLGASLLRCGYARMSLFLGTWFSVCQCSMRLCGAQQPKEAQAESKISADTNEHL